MSDRAKDAEILALRHQIAVLERQLGAATVRFTPADRALLAALLHQLPRAALRRIRLLVRPETVLRWHRDLIAARHARISHPKKVGRPPTVRSIRQLVLRLARENNGWGYRRIHGELLVLGVKVAASTVWEILTDAGIDPAPQRTGVTWAMRLRVATTGTARTGESRTRGPCTRCPPRSPIPARSRTSTSADVTVSPDWSTRTSTPLDLRGWDFRHPQRHREPDIEPRLRVSAFYAFYDAGVADREYTWTDAGKNSAARHDVTEREVVEALYSPQRIENGIGTLLLAIAGLADTARVIVVLCERVNKVNS